MSKKIILSIIIGLVVFILGGLAGIFYKTQQISLQLLMQPAQKAITALSSKLVTFSILGDVTRIQGRDITLNYEGDTITVHIKDGATIVAGLTVANVGKILPPGKFEDIKVGNLLNIQTKVLPDGQLEGQIVTIAPVFPTTTTTTTKIPAAPITQ